VSPANSFGFMNGGIDLLYSQYFGWHVQEQLQQAIKTRHYGELLVGQAEIIETDHAQIPFVIAAPTMRVPMILRDSINPFLAARAVLLLIAHGIFSTGRFAGQRVSDHVKTVAFPGLGTGVGQVGANTCAHQVRAAIEQVVLGNTQFPVSWTVAQQQHQLLYTDRVRNLQKE
ncbi:MAG TPA: macro domain-containing protein, partial [Acidobacteriota bacterium]|nr:macro domain-containing protein [Acidobacteriota bacterium]